MKRYRMDNWSEYNKSLVNRGRVNLWIDEKGLKKWLAKKQKGKNGRPYIYSDDAILLMLVLREVYGLSLRFLQGFVESIFAQMGLDIPVPSYSQVCRRASKLKKTLQKIFKKGAKNIAFDSTGLKVYGEGEWKVKIHGAGKRRTWKKFHIGIDLDTQDIICGELTDRSVGDAEAAVQMLSKIEGSLETFVGDGAYDSGKLRSLVYKLGGKHICPPPKHAKMKWKRDGWEKERDNQILEILGLGGDEEAIKLWKRLTGYSRRSLVETTMFRLKRMLGSGLKSRTTRNQESEVFCKIIVLNKLKDIGYPKNGRVEEVA